MKNCRLLCLIVFFALLAACAAQPATIPDSSPSQAVVFTDDTVIMTLENENVYWPEFEYYLEYITDYYRDSYGLEEITDWNATEEGQPLKDYFLSYAVSVAKSHRGVQGRAAELNLELSQEQTDAIEKTISDGKTAYGGPEYEAMVAQSYKSMDFYRYLMETGYLSDNLFAYYYGENGSALSDDDLLDYCADQGYMCVKFICVSDNPENRKLMEELAARLKTTGEAEFDEAMDEYSEYTDMNSTALPNGGVFAADCFGDAFYDGYMRLEENETGGVYYGPQELYIIRRLPIDPDMTNINGYPLRYSVAYSKFQEQLDYWGESVKYQLTDAYYQIELSEYSR